MAMIVIGTSAGGLEPLVTMMRGLPATLPVAICIVQHLPATGPTLLPEILSRVGPFPARLAQDRMPLEVGQTYVAPPDHHLIIELGHLHAIRGPKENGFRPAIDVLFRTAARIYATRVMGIILAGLLDDGTAGLLAIKRYGGMAMVQDPAEALYPSMPATALRYVAVDAVCRAAEMAAQIRAWSATPAPAEGGPPMHERINLEAGIAAMDPAALERAHTLGTPAPFSCPDCQGVLSEYYDGPLLRFRCQVGHVYGQDSLLANHTELLDHKLWTAFTTLNERLLLAHRLVAEAQAQGDASGERRFGQLIVDAERQKEYLRQLMLLPDQPAGQPAPDNAT